VTCCESHLVILGSAVQVIADTDENLGFRCIQHRLQARLVLHRNLLASEG
jgi:hypothetical protein